MSIETEKLILIIEDEADLSKLLEFHLQHHGYETLVVHDGMAGLNEAIQRAPDLIILDLMLPKIHGLEVCRLLRNSPAMRHVPILILSELHTTATKIRGLDMGADDYMTKPFEFAELISRVNALLRRQRCEAGAQWN
ncbi:MAG: response regulator [Verrucomicrobia bacterium]|nr:response regulator [Verrucomicrobiota bacterium]